MKKKRKTDGEDRTEAYRDWRRCQFGDTRYVLDIDQIEYKFTRGNAIKPVAVIELTRSDYKSKDPTKLYEAVLARIKDRPQGRMLSMVARCLGVNAYIVLFEKDLSLFHVYRLTNPAGWKVYDPAKYQGWINWLHDNG